MLIFKLVLINLLFIGSFFLLMPHYLWQFTLIALLLLSLAIIQFMREKQKQERTFKALTGGLRSLQDGDFSISLPENRYQRTHVQQHELISIFNDVTDKLREEKQTLYQRELLLDKVVNASDVVTVLINHRNTIIFSNLAAQHFFDEKNLLGVLWTDMLVRQMPDLIKHNDKNNAIIQLYVNEYTNVHRYGSDEKNTEQSEQSWHLSRHLVKLHGSSHQLVLLKPITKELQQQELQTWKKIIRVINHELNNSIAPISSMCHSGIILADRLNEPQLNRVFNTIRGRINKLSEFIQSYSQLARLSIPRKADFNLVCTIEQLQNLYSLELLCFEKEVILNADEGQVEQLLINLLKNAKGFSTDKTTQIQITNNKGMLNIIVRDYGPGMEPDVLTKAFLPYYSTKLDGSGIGLSICREIVDAHNGQIVLNNHPEGGLQVSVSFPNNDVCN